VSTDVTGVVMVEFPDILKPTVLREANPQVFKTFGMVIAIINTEEEAQIATAVAAKAGYRLGAISNAGLPKGTQRMSFMPNEAFND